MESKILKIKATSALLAHLRQSSAPSAQSDDTSGGPAIAGMAVPRVPVNTCPRLLESSKLSFPPSTCTWERAKNIVCKGGKGRTYQVYQKTGNSGSKAPFLALVGEIFPGLDWRTVHKWRGRGGVPPKSLVFRQNNCPQRVVGCPFGRQNPPNCN